jgi:hypothetical protein
MWRRRNLTPYLISIGEGWLLITFAGSWLLIPFPTRGGPAPFSYLPGHWRFSLLGALNKMDMDSAVDIHKQPNPEPVALGKCMLILFFVSRLAIPYYLLECLPKWLSA